MKVCMITTSFPRSDRDYSGLFIYRLCRALAASGVEVDVVAPSASEAAVREVMGGSRIHRFSYFSPRRWQRLAYGPGGIPANVARNPWVLFQTPFFLIAYLSKAYRVAKGADLIHAHWIYSGVVAWVIRLLCGTPFVLTLRGTDAALSRKNRFVGFVSLWIIRRADCVTTVNRELESWLLSKQIPGDRVVFIRNGVEIGQRKTRREEDETFRLLFVGSLIPGKGTKVLIDALSRLLSSEKDLLLSVVGDGSERQLLQRIAKEKGIESHVEFAGAQPPERIAEWMERSDCLVHPSFSEGTPNVVLEAMAASLPVVATDLSGIREVVADGISGFLVKPGDPDGLAERVLQLVRDRGLGRRMGEKGREAILAMGLGWDRVADRYREIYQKACAASSESSI
jgi:glycosyltransferase involved in cell wall biosynthesis